MIQEPLPAVGDTVWVERLVTNVGTAVLRPQPWSVGAVGQQLGPAVVQIQSGGALVRYPMVFWYPGDHQLKMPGPVLVRRDGSSDTLAASPVRVRVGSVLPIGTSRAALAPKPARAAVPLEAETLLPLVLLVTVVLLAIGLVALRWRRRGKMPTRREAPAPPPLTTFQQFAATGEYRAALHELAWILADRMRGSRDLDQTAELQKILDQISFSSFSPRAEGELAALYQRAERLVT